MTYATAFTFARTPLNAARGQSRTSFRGEGGGTNSEHSRRTHEQKPEQLAHASVMPKEALEQLALKRGDVVVDATAGEGGHSHDILAADKSVSLLALDADLSAVTTTRTKLAPFGERATVVESNFADLAHVLKKHSIESIHKALFDLGWNSGQLVSGRGFSFLVDEPLNMSYGKKPASGFTARDVINDWDEETLADVFFGYGEERYARRIAKAVVERRRMQPIETTIELVEIVKDAVPPAYRHGRLHPATRTFQALRMAVNDELGVIERGITAAWEHLACDGRIVVITFHSIEDRLVKHLFAGYAKSGSARLVVKKPLSPSRGEVTHNPRARSAKMRVIEKLCNEQ